MENLPNQISSLSEIKTICLSTSPFIYCAAILVSLFWGYYEWQKKLKEQENTQNKIFLCLYNFRAALFGFVSSLAGFVALYAEYILVCNIKISDINIPILILIFALAYIGVMGISGVLAEKIYFFEPLKNK